MRFQTRRARAIELVRQMGPVDLIVNSLASPKRTHPKPGETYKSVLKPIGSTYHGRTLDTDRGLVTDWRPVAPFSGLALAFGEGGVLFVGGEGELAAFRWPPPIL